MNIKKYAAIDIGSNAVRLLIADVIEHEGSTYFKKNELIRVPIRLGEDTFINQLICDNNIIRLCDALKSFNLLMKVYGVVAYKACATSAIREAKNADKVVEKVFAESGVEIDIIDGNTEAKIIAATDLNDILDPNRSYLFVDVGGGSTEFSIFEGLNKINSKSFKIGTVRMINDSISDEIWNDLKLWIKSNTKNYENITILGTGGNINKLFKMSNQKPFTALKMSFLKTKLKEFSSLSYEDRIIKLGLKPDRADVILPATKLYLNAMKWSGAKAILVPKIGLSDGIIKSMYTKAISSYKI